VLRLLVAEALTVVAVGTLLGLSVAALDLLGTRTALTLLSAPARRHLPWPALGTATAACAFLAALATHRKSRPIN
jgi:putative ABC transport system permease protein